MTSTYLLQHRHSVDVPALPSFDFVLMCEVLGLGSSWGPLDLWSLSEGFCMLWNLIQTSKAILHLKLNPQAIQAEAKKLGLDISKCEVKDAKV